MDEAIRLRPDVEWRAIDGEVVVLDLATSAYLAVNDTGAVLWPLVAAGARQADLVDELAQRYRLEPDQAKADVEAFVASLRALSLVEVAD